MPPTRAAGGADEVVAALNCTLASASGRWLLAAHPGAAAEQAWTSHDGTTTSLHVIDRCFVADGCRWIIDYKTARLPEAELPQRAASYRPQLERLCPAVRRRPAAAAGGDLFPMQGCLVELPLAKPGDHGDMPRAYTGRSLF